MLGVQLQLAATTSAPSSTWPLGPLGPLCICALDGGGASSFVGLEEDDEMGSTHRDGLDR